MINGGVVRGQSVGIAAVLVTGGGGKLLGSIVVTVSSSAVRTVALYMRPIQALVVSSVPSTIADGYSTVRASVGVVSQLTQEQHRPTCRWWRIWRTGSFCSWAAARGCG